MADGWDISQEPLIEASNKKLDIVDGHAVKAPADYQNPDELYNSLIARIQKYHPSADISMVEKAYCIAKNAHEGQKRKSGKPISFIRSGLESFWRSWRWIRRRSQQESFTMLWKIRS